MCLLRWELKHVVVSINLNARMCGAVKARAWSYRSNLFLICREEDVRAEKGVTADDVNKFLAGGIVLFNLTSLSIIRTTHLELTRVRIYPNLKNILHAYTYHQGVLLCEVPSYF